MIVRHSRTINVEFKGGEPPKEFCLIPWGTNESENGPYTYDEKSVKTVRDGYKRRGIDCMFDWHHASLDPKPVDPAESIKAAGWYKLDFRDDGLWAVNISWTPLALQKFADKEIRYFSPAFDADKTGRVVDFINCALTNLPATHNNEQLVAASRKVDTEMTDEEKKEMARLREENEKYKKSEEARKDEEEKREEARKAEETKKSEEAKKKAKKAKTDDEDEDDEDEESKHAQDDEDEESRKMSRMLLAQHKEILALRSGRTESREDQISKLPPSVRKMARRLVREDLDELVKIYSKANKEYKAPEDQPVVGDDDLDTKTMQLARKIGEAIGNNDEQITKAVKLSRGAR